ncbi:MULTISPECIES: hypothetical protein [Methylobacterium]|uniref:hypothetical protein n=1 Tax=Methylobacterium TaxID=407 RepID=UPI0013EB9084|nr:hypothetical protein [Methylobacterium sp. DB0501]NGM32580.1 hypothetical protein [Methylobacterium sp. DB0501]
MQQRVEALEKGMQKLEGKIDRLTELVNGFGLKTSERLGTIEGRLTGIEKTLESRAAKSDLTPLEAKIAAVDGKIAHLPTTSAMITLMLGAVGLSLGGAAGLAFTLFRIFKP